MAQLTDDVRAYIQRSLSARPGKTERANYRHKIGGSGSRGKKASNFPYKSDALGVTIDQIESQEEQLRANGCTMEFDRETGEAIVTSERQYQQAARVMGLRNGRDGYDGLNTGRHNARSQHSIREKVKRWAETGEADDTIREMFG